MQNTLFNYFNKKTDSGSNKNSPSQAKNESVKKEPVKKEEVDVEDKENAASAARKKIKLDKPAAAAAGEKEHAKQEVKMETNNDEDEEDEIIRRIRLPEPKSKRSCEEETPKNVKKRRLMVLSDSDASDNEEKKKKVSSPEVELESSEEEEDDEEEEEKKSKAAAKKTTIKNKNLSIGGATNSPKTPKGAAKNKASSVNSPSLTAFAADPSDSGPVQIIESKFKHYSYDFLREDKIKDINGIRKGEPDYDPRTLYVPADFKRNVTPGLRQWWELKSKNFDIILFFKVGKFYELYHMDAVIAVKELGLVFMKGDYAHCGFPEIAFSRYADGLVCKGYKVARVEQTETPEDMKERTGGTKEDKTVRREICRITTPGTKTFNLLDGEVSNAFSQYLFSFTEKVSTVQEKKVRSFGVCFLDTTVGKIHIGQFDDDRNCSKFRTTLAHFPPAHILYQKNGLTKETKSIIELHGGIKDALVNEKEMYSASKVLKTLLESDYFQDENGKPTWPESFKPLLSEHDTLGLTAKSEFELAVNALGGVLWCLKNCLIDTEILTMKNFEIYQPIDNIVTQDIKKNEFKKSFIKQKYMVLDSISLTNLEIFENNFDNTQAGTLYQQLDFCSTMFGKRLLKYWLVNPLCDPDAINDRLDAIEDLSKLDARLSSIMECLKQMPDLERLVSKTHQLGNVRADHPDSRAVMYENDTYSKKKVEDFISLLNGFASANKILTALGEVCSNFKSKLLKSIVTVIKPDETGKKNGFPYLDDLIESFNTSFDVDIAKKTGKIIPSKGRNKEYEQAKIDIKNIEEDLNKYLKKQSAKLKTSLSYTGTGRNRYQLEIPENKCNNLPEDFELISGRKGFKRYWSDDIKEMHSNLIDAETRRDKALRDSMKLVFKEFDAHYNVWNRATQCLSILDVLVSLTNYLRNSEQQMCRPEIVMLEEESKTPLIDIRNGRHPCITKTFTGDFIPNDIVVGCQDSNNNWQKNPLILVTGPNMGGKSTLMRQAGLIVILAQIGSYVPADSCRLSPVDRIFTRIGATDKILAGESTFFLELSETASILHHATKHSLILMDELGRGTATFDGTAIAFSVVKELATNIKARTLFSTHYHHLVEEFSADKDNVSMGHMECMVSDEDQGITFLYKFGPGACPKSHGFNAARLADIPDEIIKVGSAKSVEFENFTKKIQLLKKSVHAKSKDQIKEIFEKLKGLKF